jgi:hypothetical protein
MRGGDRKMTKRKHPTEETLSEEGLPLIQLATRIPRDLHKVVKVYCVNHDTSVADFVTDALRHELEARRAEETPRTKPTKKRTVYWNEDDDYVPNSNDEDAA